MATSIALLGSDNYTGLLEMAHTAWRVGAIGVE